MSYFFKQLNLKMLFNFQTLIEYSISVFLTSFDDKHIGGGEGLLEWNKEES